MSFKLLTDYLESEDVIEKMEGLQLTEGAATVVQQKQTKPYNGITYFANDTYSYWSNDRPMESHVFKTATYVQSLCTIGNTSDYYYQYLEYVYDPLLRKFELAIVIPIEIMRKNQPIVDMLTIDNETGEMDFPLFETADLQNKKMLNVKIYKISEFDIKSDTRMSAYQKMQNIKYIENCLKKSDEDASEKYDRMNTIEIGDYFWRPHEVDGAFEALDLLK